MSICRTDALPDTVGKAALTSGHWKKRLTWAGSWVAPVVSCPSQLGTLPRTLVSVHHWLWLGYLDLAAIV